MSRDRRVVYRVSPQPGDELSLAILSPIGEARSARIVDLTIEGAGIRFASAGQPALGEGDRAKLLFSSPRLPSPVELEAVVVAQVEGGPYTHYGLRFERVEQEPPPAPGDFYRLFNRRGAYRGAEPDPNDPIEVGIVGPKGRPKRGPRRGGWAELGRARLINISATGMSVVAEGDLDAALAGAEQVDVRVRLPPEHNEMCLAVSVRYRLAEGEGARYGLAIDPKRTEEYLDKEEEIVEYVMRRYSETLERGVH